jgi:leucyl/phenylalanyl-tRNA--protein transferase
MLTERCGEDWTVDVQWSTPHLESLGVSELSGLDYLVRLRQAEARDGSELFYR